VPARAGTDDADSDHADSHPAISPSGPLPAGGYRAQPLSEGTWAETQKSPGLSRGILANHSVGCSAVTYDLMTPSLKMEIFPLFEYAHAIPVTAPPTMPVAVPPVTFPFSGASATFV
jgi:hypothetical protein